MNVFSLPSCLMHLINGAEMWFFLNVSENKTFAGTCHLAAVEHFEYSQGHGWQCDVHHHTGREYWKISALIDSFLSSLRVVSNLHVVDAYPGLWGRPPSSEPSAGYHIARMPLFITNIRVTLTGECSPHTANAPCVSYHWRQVLLAQTIILH